MPFNMLTTDVLTDMSYARHRDALADAGVRLLPDDIARLNEVVGADPALAAADAEPDADQRMRSFRSIVRNAMTTLAQEILDSGVDRSALPTYSAIGTPEPTVWANGVALQRVAETALAELDTLAAAVALSAGAGSYSELHAIPGLGSLYTIEQLAEMLQVSAFTLAYWRRENRHFEYLKFPGGRGIVRYTERGIRAFFAAHLPTPVTE